MQITPQTLASLGIHSNLSWKECTTIKNHSLLPDVWQSNQEKQRYIT